MAQNTILEMLHRAPSLPPITEEEQALMNAMAEREHAETRARRTAERPGISDAAWRAAYGVADVVDPAIGSLADLAIGATVGADPFSRTQPIWEQRPSMQEVGETIATAVMPLASPLRKAAYRTLMLKKLLAQISKLEPGVSRQMFERLLKTHPRVMAAFEHSGGKIRTDPAYSSPELIQQAIDERRLPEQLGAFQQGASSGDFVPGLRDVQQGPTLDITPQAIVDTLNPGVATSGVTGKIGLDLGDTSAHEITHWAQHLGSRAAKRASQVVAEVNPRIRRYNELDQATRLSPAGRQLNDEILKLKSEHAVLVQGIEESADQAGSNKARQMFYETAQTPEDFLQKFDDDAALVLKQWGR
jgi:hypothetical protein